jgi:hypothetical protein
MYAQNNIVEADDGETSGYPEYDNNSIENWDNGKMPPM